MHGTPQLVLAAIGIPSAWPCFVFTSPFVTVIVLRWILRHTDHAIDRLFPQWEWEKRLGWLNFRTQRRTETVLRWIGYFLYALLAAALYGIVWAAPVLGMFDRWSDVDVLSEIWLKLPVLFVCLGLWLFYLGFELYPKLHRQHEWDELEKFRTELTEREEESDPDSRHKPLSKSSKSGRSVSSKINSSERSTRGQIEPGN